MIQVAGVAEQSPEVEGRRKAPRAYLEVEVDFQDETTFYRGFSENISSGGVFIATYNLLEIGKRITLRLTLPSGAAVDVQGSVQWLRDVRDPSSGVSPGFGVKFDDLSPEAEASISEFVTEREPMFYID